MEVDMSQRHLRVVGIALLALLACPRAGSAGIIDFIWEMSGPQLIGFSLYHCELDLHRDPKDKSHPEESNPRCEPLPAREGHRHGLLRLTLDASPYFSTGKNSDTNRFEWFKNGMVAVEPMLEARWPCCAKNGEFSVHHDVGFSYSFLFGEHFARFNTPAVKITPAGVRFNKRISLAYNLRLYYKLRPEDFESGPRLVNLIRKSERVHGISLDVNLSE
jgi:hypothetical protein